jgi:hypothetical protein
MNKSNKLKIINGIQDKVSKQDQKTQFSKDLIQIITPEYQ